MMSGGKKRLRRLLWRDVAPRHSTRGRSKDNMLKPSAAIDEESLETPTIEPADKSKAARARMGDVTAASPAPHSSTSSIIPAPHRTATTDAGLPAAAVPAGHALPADHALTPADEALTGHAPGVDVPDAEAPATELAGSKPAAVPRPTELVAGMIEVPTMAPTIGNVRGLPGPCLAAGVQYRVPMVVLDGGAVGSYHLAAASQGGTSHLIDGSPRQDAYDFVLTATGRLVVAIADGLGSRPASQVGARLFCEQVVFAGVTKPDSSAQDYLVAAAIQAGAVAEAAYALAYDDISFVAAVAVFSPEGCELARVGDVSGFSCQANGVFEELFVADGDSINVVAASLPSTTAPTPERNMTLFSGPVVLATDGLANDIRTSVGLRVWLGEQWRMPLGAYAMAESLRYRRQGSHDDRTAVVVWPQTRVLTV